MGQRTYNRQDCTVLLDDSPHRLLPYLLPADEARDRRVGPGFFSYRAGRVSQFRLIHAETPTAN